MRTQNHSGLLCTLMKSMRWQPSTWSSPAVKPWYSPNQRKEGSLIQSKAFLTNIQGPQGSRKLALPTMTRILRRRKTSLGRKRMRRSGWRGIEGRERGKERRGRKRKNRSLRRISGGLSSEEWLLTMLWPLIKRRWTKWWRKPRKSKDSLSKLKPKEPRVVSRINNSTCFVN